MSRHAQRPAPAHREVDRADRPVNRHRAEPPPRYTPRYGRFAVLGASLATTAVAMLGGVGVLPSAADDEPDTSADLTGVVADRTDDTVPTSRRTASPSETPTAEPSEDASTDAADDPSSADETDETDGAGATEAADEAPAPPVTEADGKRVIFSEDDQRVWLIGETGKVKRSYLVSGSLTDNLDPGTYQVYSRSEDAFGIDDSGTMKWFVRFTQGPSGAAIGFHTIPIDDGARVQTVGDLGTPQSHGCIRQKTSDARALWAFAPLGTTVVVV